MKATRMGLPVSLTRPLAAALAAALSLAAASAGAQPADDFYKGKTIRMVVGVPAGSGNDLMARPVADALARHIPGRPTVIVQNMPGGGSLVAARYMAEAAPRDGTVIGLLAQTLALDAAVQGEKAGINVSQLPYIGRIASSVEIGHGMPGARFKTFEDVRRTEIIAGAPAGNNPAFLTASALNRYAGAKLRIVTGYRAGAEVRLAAEKGEVELVPSTSLNTLMASNPDWITERKVPILYQGATRRHPLLPDVPTLPELGLTEEGRTILGLIASTGDIGRALVATPELPRERLAVLRKAMAELLAEPDFKAQMAARKMPVEPATGETLDAIALTTARTPRGVLEQISALTRQ